MEENFTTKGIRTRTLLAMLRFRLASFQPDGTPRTYAMGVRERFEPIDSPLYTRGELESARRGRPARARASGRHEDGPRPSPEEAAGSSWRSGSPRATTR